MYTCTKCQSGVVLGQVQPVTVVTEPEAAVEPENVVGQIIGDSPSEPPCPTSRNSKLIESIHVEQSLSTDQVK